MILVVFIYRKTDTFFSRACASRVSTKSCQANTARTDRSIQKLQKKLCTCVLIPSKSKDSSVCFKSGVLQECSAAIVASINLWHEIAHRHVATRLNAAPQKSERNARWGYETVYGNLIHSTLNRSLWCERKLSI